MSTDQDKKPDIDLVTGVETTGHEWDGLKELNNPLPRWWLWVFIATVIWSIWYFIVYPAWPISGGATLGTSGYTQFKELEHSQAEIVARQAIYLERFGKSSFNEIMNDPELYSFAIAGGSIAFKNNCAVCHGSGGQGAKGYPNLNDDDWLWGGKLTDIHYTLKHGIRSDDEQTHMSQMPAFGRDGFLKSGDINNVVDYVLSLSGAQPTAGAANGMQIFKAQCSVCHGPDGKGNRNMGAPNLTDKIWLYGGDRQAIFETIYSSRAGVMPAWGRKLDENTIRELTVYIHQLGGGEPSDLPAESPLPPQPALPSGAP